MTKTKQGGNLMRSRDTEPKINYAIIQYGWIAIFILLALGLEAICEKYPKIRKYLE